MKTPPKRKVSIKGFFGTFNGSVEKAVGTGSEGHLLVLKPNFSLQTGEISKTWPKVFLVMAVSVIWRLGRQYRQRWVVDKVVLETSHDRSVLT